MDGWWSKHAATQPFSRNSRPQELRAYVRTAPCVPGSQVRCEELYHPHARSVMIVVMVVVVMVMMVMVVTMMNDAGTAARSCSDIPGTWYVCFVAVL